MEDYSTFIIENFRNTTGISIIVLFILTGLLMLYLYNKYYTEIQLKNKVAKHLFSFVCMTDFVATFIAIGILIMVITGSSFGFMAYTIGFCVLTLLRINSCN